MYSVRLKMIEKGEAVMRTYFWVLALSATILIGHETFCMAEDQREKPATGISNEAFYRKICRDGHLNDHATAQTGFLLAADSDRGCCVLKTSQAKCVYTNRAYCMHKAKQAGISFEFYMGTDCKAIASCQ